MTKDTVRKLLELSRLSRLIVDPELDRRIERQIDDLLKIPSDRDWGDNWESDDQVVTLKLTDSEDTADWITDCYDLSFTVDLNIPIKIFSSFDRQNIPKLLKQSKVFKDIEVTAHKIAPMMFKEWVEDWVKDIMDRPCGRLSDFNSINFESLRFNNLLMGNQYIGVRFIAKYSFCTGYHPREFRDYYRGSFTELSRIIGSRIGWLKKPKRISLGKRIFV